MATHLRCHTNSYQGATSHTLRIRSAQWDLSRRFEFGTRLFDMGTAAPCSWRYAVDELHIFSSVSSSAATLQMQQACKRTSD